MLHRLAWPSLLGALSLGALALVSACSSEEAPPPTPEPPPEMTLASFDAGLSVGAATAVDGRAAVMMDALADLKADVLCTQEIFRPADKSALETALGDAYPTKLSIANDPNDQEEDNPACGEDEANDAITCIETSGCEQMCVDDRDACIDMACAIKLPPDKAILHAVPQSFIIDGQANITRPVGVEGVRLEVQAHLVVGDTQALKQLEQCIRHAKLRVIDMILAPLAQAEALLSPQGRDLGVVLVTDDGDAKLRGLDVGEPPAGASAQLFGAWRTTSPERILGQAFDHRSDQFGLCALLWYALFGQWPFAAPSVLTVFGAS